MEGPNQARRSQEGEAKPGKANQRDAKGSQRDAGRANQRRAKPGMRHLGANLGPTWGQHGPTWGQLGVNLGSTCSNLRPTGANMQQLGVNLWPTRANMVARGQLGVNMYFAKPEKLVFRLDGSNIFQVRRDQKSLQNCTKNRFDQKVLKKLKLI